MVLNFEKEFYGRWIDNKKQCSTKSPSGPCPDEAYYFVNSSDGRETEFYCIRCTSAVLFHCTTRGRILQIGRIKEG